jgi:SAM-dependent methyltransferase
VTAGPSSPPASTDWGKANFGSIYDCPDPRPYFATLHPLGYQIPHHGQAVFRTLVDALHGLRPDRTPLNVVDLCCSYGINAALLNHRVTLADLYARYASPRATALSSRHLAVEDRAFYAARRTPRTVSVTGVDAAPRAVGYAREVGLHDHSFAENLEVAAASADLRRALAATDLVTVTGGVSYVYTRTFRALLDCVARPPWIAAFVLRTVPYEPIAELLARSGLVTEKLPARTFRQRRFADDAERDAAFDALAGIGLRTEDREADGYYHADLFLSRPAADVAALPLALLL